MCSDMLDMLGMLDKDRGAHTTGSPAPSRPTRGVDARSCADYSKTHAESQSEQLGACRPIFDSPLPVRLGASRERQRYCVTCQKACTTLD